MISASVAVEAPIKDAILRDSATIAASSYESRKFTSNLGFALPHTWADAVRPYSRFITLARYPAPKPLSIFTTQTLGEQLLSMPSKAARPWKLAP